MQDWVSIDPDLSHVSGAHFIYRAAASSQYRVAGWPSRVLSNVQVPVCYAVSASDMEERDIGTMGYGLTRRWLATAREADDPLGGDRTLHWWRALRRFAIQQAMNELDAGTLTGDLGLRVLGRALGANDADALRAFQYRECLFQEEDERGGLHCRADRGSDDMTTRAICPRCPVPDPWEICRHVTGVSTKGVYTDQEGLRERVLLPAVCQLGKTPGNGIPSSCRGGGPGRPACFEPREIVSRLLHVKAEEEEVEDWVSAVNLTWQKRYGFALFSLVSVVPFRYLRGACTDSADFYSRVSQLGELLESLNEAEMRTRLSEDVAKTIPVSQTVNVLEAFLRKQGFRDPDGVAADLRRLVQLRLLPPRHSAEGGGRRGIEELERMGFAYPLARESCKAAWEMVLGIFASALRALRDVPEGNAA